MSSPYSSLNTRSKYCAQIILVQQYTIPPNAAPIPHQTRKPIHILGCCITPYRPFPEKKTILATLHNSAAALMHHNNMRGKKWYAHIAVLCRNAKYVFITAISPFSLTVFDHYTRFIDNCQQSERILNLYQERLERNCPIHDLI